MSHKPVVTEEVKTFLQEGLSNYAPALIALTEFRSQIRSKLLAVFDEFSSQFTEFGILTKEGWVPKGRKLDDPQLAEKRSAIGIEKKVVAATDTTTGCYIEWNLEEPPETQVWVAVWIYVANRRDRDRLFSALEKQRSSSARTELFQDSNGSVCLSAYCATDQFHCFDDTLRSVIEEWLDLLTAVGGIAAFVSPKSATRGRPEA